MVGSGPQVDGSAGSCSIKSTGRRRARGPTPSSADGPPRNDDALARGVIPRLPPMRGCGLRTRRRHGLATRIAPMYCIAIHHVARTNRTDAFRRPRHHDVAGIERVPLRRPRDQLARLEDQVACSTLLTSPFTRSSKSTLSGSGARPVTSHGPSTVAVDRLPEAAVFGAAHAHVERDRVTGYIVERLRFRKRLQRRPITRPNSIS